MAHSLNGRLFSVPEGEICRVYDKIKLKGKAPELSYIYINNDTVEIRDASHLKGMGCTETGDALKKELKDDRVQVVAIGLAGENRVYTASMDHGHSSAARGPAPVMGDKRIKAIAVRGTKDINVAHPKELFDLCMKLHKKIAESNGCGDWMGVDEDDSFSHMTIRMGQCQDKERGFWNKEHEERGGEGSSMTHGQADKLLQLSQKMQKVINWPGAEIGSDTNVTAKLHNHMAAFKELDSPMNTGDCTGIRA
jgi:aldehyde:ferredoxin oxidoreductase